MSILGIILAIALVGVVLWLINTYLPMAAPFKKILNIVAVVALVFWLLQAFGILAYLGNARI